MRLLLSADWQIGMRFRQFGAKAAWLREVRVRTLGRVLEMAAERQVDALVIAGDLFEDHQLDAAEVARVFALLEEHSATRVFIVPGNHDPVGSPGAIWARRPFVHPPPHVMIFATPAAVELAGGWLLANPLTQKGSALDPTNALAELARSLPQEAVKLGVTHGSPAIGSRHNPHDFPIALDAATRAGLDFLGLGHWHSSLSLDGGRMLMTGTPEPTSFDEGSSGFVHEIEVRAGGATPAVTALPSAELSWRELACGWGGAEETRARLASALAPNDPAASRTVLRVCLQGLVAPGDCAALTEWLAPRLAAYAIADVRDETAPEFSREELAGVEREHPLLGQVLEDLAFLAGGASTPAASGAPPAKLPATTVPAFSRAEVEALEKRIGTAPGELSPALLASARRLLLEALREVESC